MIKIVKHHVPLFTGERGKGILHVVILDEKDFETLIEEVDKDDRFANDRECWPRWDEFAGLAYERTTQKGHNDWWLMLPIQSKTIIPKIPKDKKKKGQKPKSKIVSSKISVNVVAHESLHITRMILASRGVYFDPNNDETYAYMVGWVADKAWNSIPAKYKKV